MKAIQLQHCCSVAYIHNVEWQFETAQAMYDAMRKIDEDGFGPSLIAVQHRGAKEITWMTNMGFEVVGKTSGGGSILLLSPNKLKDPTPKVKTTLKSLLSRKSKK